MDIDFDQFDDELQIMQELMKENKIALQDKDLRRPIARLNASKAVTVEKGTALNSCIDLLIARGIGCLVVVDDGKLCGIFTERDVLLKIAGKGIDLEKEVIDDFMTANPIPIKIDSTIEDALKLMHQGRYRHVSIVDENQTPLYVVSIKDIVGYIIEFFPQDVLNLPPHPIRVGTKHREGG